jgi:hypothetical protein
MNTPIEYEVEGKDALIAAVRAAAQPTHEAARQCPVSIRLLGTRCKYLFPDGSVEGRAEQIARRIRKIPARAFQ